MECYNEWIIYFGGNWVGNCWWRSLSCYISNCYYWKCGRLLGML